MSVKGDTDAEVAQSEYQSFDGRAQPINSADPLPTQGPRETARQGCDKLILRSSSRPSWGWAMGEALWLTKRYRHECAVGVLFTTYRAAKGLKQETRLATVMLRLY